MKWKWKGLLHEGGSRGHDGGNRCGMDRNLQELLLGFLFKFPEYEAATMLNDT